MKTHELYFFRTEVLEPLRARLQVEAAKAEEADCKAWKEYETLSDDEYYMDAAAYDAHVDETTKRAQLLSFQYESACKAVEAILALELEADYLEGVGLI